MIFWSPKRPFVSVDNFVDKVMVTAGKARQALALLDCSSFYQPGQTLQINGLRKKSRRSRKRRHAKPHEIGLNAIL
jgi:hypothetical protein